MIGLTLISKFSATETCVPGMVVSFGSLLEFSSWVVVLIVIAVQDSMLYVFRRLLFTTSSLTAQGVLCILLGVALHYILNIINFVFYLRYITADPAYQKWLKTPAHSRVHKATLVISLLVTYKFSNLPFSKCFGSQCFKAPLSQPVVFTPLNIVSGIGFAVSILMIVGCGLISYDSTTISMSSLFIQSIDVIVVTTLILLFSIWNFRRPDEFFDEDSKLNTASEEVYNDTLAGMINQSEFGDRVSVDEMEVGMVGQRNYSRLIREPKSSKVSKVSKLSKAHSIEDSKDGSGILFNADQSREGLNIHDMSSEYVSEKNEESKIGDVPIVGGNLK